MKTTTLLLFLLCLALAGHAQTKTIDLFPAQILHNGACALEVSGKPQIVPSPYGEALHFNGINDQLLLGILPLKSVPEFTVEMLFKPDSTDQFEQRMLHIGEDRGDRMLLELRAVNGNWYFDGYAASGTNKKALIDENKLHSLGQWYHVAFVVSPGSLSTFVNGKQELHEEFPFRPIESGKTSIGARLDKRSWFCGSIYQIRITPKAVPINEWINSETKPNKIK